MPRNLILAMALAAVTCSDVTGPSSLEGSWSGHNATYQAVELSLDLNGNQVLGTLLLRDASGTTAFDGPVVGSLTGSNRAVVTGALAPSAGGGTVTVDAQLEGSRLNVTLTSTWLPSATLTLTWAGP
jgi:hypothetical protein